MNDLSEPTPEQLRRTAVIRQSSPGQVARNTESRELQYELAERALSLGWHRDQIVVIDEDLGLTGSEATNRSGFQRLVADVALGRVGVVVGIEVSRLARRNADWYNLMDLCALTNTLIADGDGVYHPADYNSRLVLGLKGTIAELHLIRGRLAAGRRHKAAKGELRQLLPVGLDYDDAGAVILSPDESVRAAICEVFSGFAELTSLLVRSRHNGRGADTDPKCAARARRGRRLLCILGFSFDPQALGTTDGYATTDEGFDVAVERALGRVPVLLVRMNSDLLMGEDLKKTGAGNLFTYVPHVA
jgi:DNA invertase Pin-like site-specific DNA recombinase